MRRRNANANPRADIVADVYAGRGSDDAAAGNDAVGGRGRANGYASAGSYGYASANVYAGSGVYARPRHSDGNAGSPADARARCYLCTHRYSRAHCYAGSSADARARGYLCAHCYPRAHGYAGSRADARTRGYRYAYRYPRAYCYAGSCADARAHCYPRAYCAHCYPHAVRPRRPLVFPAQRHRGHRQPQRLPGQQKRSADFLPGLLVKRLPGAARRAAR